MKVIKEFWTQAILILVGVAAVGVLLTVPFRSHSCEWLDQTEDRCAVSMAGQLHCDPADRERAMVHELGVRSVTRLLKKVQHHQANLGRSVTALATLGSPAIGPLAARLDDRSDAVRFVVTRTLVCLGGMGQLEPQADKVVPGLIRRLRDRRLEVRYAAILALLSCGPRTEQAVPALIVVLRDNNGLSDPDQNCIQQAAAYVLGKIGPGAKAAVPALNWILHDKTSQARGTAATALWRISCDPQLVVPELCSMFMEADRATRYQALAALRTISRETELSPELLARVEASRCGEEPLRLTEGP